MKRVMMYTPGKPFTQLHSQTGGVKRFLELFYALQQNEDVEVILYCGESQADIERLHLKAQTLAAVPMKKGRILPVGVKILWRNFSQLRKIQKRETFDAVLVFDVPTAIHLCMTGFSHIQLLLRQDLIEYKTIELEESKRSRLYRSLFLSLMRRCEAICCKKAENIIVQCQYDLDHLLERHAGLKQNILSKSAVQINNVNPSWIVQKSEAISVNTEEKAERDDLLRAVFIGDFNSIRKGAHLLLPAVERLQDEGQRIGLTVIGGGRNEEQYRERYKNRADISFLGRLDNPLSVVKCSDLAVVPSLADSCPNTVLEALYNHVPAIGAKSGGIPEILVSEDALFDPDEDALYHKLKQCLNTEFIEHLKQQQAVRTQELTFDWATKICDILRIH